LYSRSDETGDQALLNVNWAVNYWIQGGLPKEKLILGMATYGRSFRLTNQMNHQPGDASNGPGLTGTVNLFFC
jgi:chitinase